MTIDALKFETGTTIFSKNYIKKSLHQKSYNTLAIEYLAEMIPTWFPESTELSILDLCCGDGTSTNQLFEALIAKKIKIKTMLGYDISPEQIEIANNLVRNDSRLAFKVMDAEKINEHSQYDLVISFFGLHWLEQIKPLVRRIHRSLKQEGWMVFLVPLEKIELFNLRQQCISSSSWKKYFEGYTLYPFHYSALDYSEPFAEYFHPGVGNSSGDSLKRFTKEDFVKFLGSWLQEERYLRLNFGQDIAKQYIHALIDSIQESPYEYAYLNKNNEHLIQFIERYLFWQGKRRLEPKKTNEIINVPPLTPLQANITKNYIGFFHPKTFMPITNEGSTFLSTRSLNR